MYIFIMSSIYNKLPVDIKELVDNKIAEEHKKNIHKYLIFDLHKFFYYNQYKYENIFPCRDWVGEPDDEGFIFIEDGIFNIVEMNY